MELPARFGKFVLKRRLGRGGMAEVFLASLPGAEGFEKELVVKLILSELSDDEGFVRRFVDEAKTCVRLTHPNIVSVFELGVEAGVLYMAMELVRGATLTELGAEGRLAPEEGAYIGMEVARALHHAHRRGVLHRDVTPGNVMLDEDGVVKLLDFGIAAPVQGAPAASEEIFGTPGHMPLEQMDGGALTPASDLFALGTVLVEAWTGRAPYRRADAKAARTALLEGEPPVPSREIGALVPLDELVRALLSRDPAERPQHADDVARVLRQFLGERGVDLDDLASRLGDRVTRLLATPRGETGGATMPRAMRPTPFAEPTQTFATRGEPRVWAAAQDNPEPGSTRPMREDAEPRAQEPGTRRLDAPSPDAPAPGDVAKSPEPLRPILGWPAALLGAAALVAIAVWMSGRNAPAPREKPAAAEASVTTAAGPSAVSSASSGSAPSAPSGAPSVAASVSAGTVVVLSTPPAKVEIDGQAVGETPVTRSVGAGDHRVVLRPRGLGESFTRTVAVTAGGRVTVRGDFNDEPIITVR